jgi:serine/threonine protein kinase
MLAGYYHNPTDCQVVVLDFDLSWHRDAFENTVIQGQHVSGYLAPEQYQRSSTAPTTRSALVDSYGIGMTLYFIATGSEPVVAEHRHVDWLRQLRERISSRECAEWKSLPARFARLIEGATSDRQQDRWDLTAIKGELDKLSHCLADSSGVYSAELVAEELLARTDYVARYGWDDDAKAARIDLPTGVTLTVEGVETEAAVRLLLCWQERRKGEQKNVDKWMQDALNSVAALLRKAGWTIDIDRGSGSHEFRIWAVAGVDSVRSNFSAYGQSVEAAMQALEFK